MTLLVGALTIGLILSLLALGVFISFRIFAFPDITADGSIAVGGATSASLIVAGVDPIPATILATLAGIAAGATTGILHARFKIHGLLAGILVMTALYSINLHIMGKSNVPLISQQTLATRTEAIGVSLAGGAETVSLWGWELRIRDASTLTAAWIVTVMICLILYIFLKTNLGTAMRATGDNPQMIRALGVNVDNMIILGLAISNGIIALSGALLAQYQGFADVQMGIGMIVIGLASVILGEALVGRAGIGLTITGAVMGAVLFRLIVAIALQWGLDPNDLKLATAVFVFVALVIPHMLARTGRKLIGAAHA
ncbi:MAG: ABC transporter permease [Planctomycetota bacterium]|nr:MAG: ABC transporter permease [Planctomycetota bacterium]